MKTYCPNHDDTNPSMHLYEERGYCFVCGYSCPVEDVADPSDLKRIKREKTNILGMLEYIQTCPKQEIRGLKFHYDDTGYYIIWPDKSFYKKRMFEGKTRYIGPRGNKPPMFFYPQSPRDLIVIEGEINAISLYEAKVTEFSIASPGSATELSTHLPKYLTFERIFVIVDRDNAGVAYGLELKSALLRRKKKVQLIATEEDLNEIYEEKGREGIKDFLEANLDL